VHCKPGERYCYDGVLLDVVDGDTAIVRLSLGFGTYKKERIRLRCVEAPELILPEGKKAMAFIKRRIKPGDKIEILTYHRYIYGRYIGDIFYGDPKKFLNRECIESAYASASTSLQ
jgi:endonuclease YncB( thermonuclease family)